MINKKKLIYLLSLCLSLSIFATPVEAKTDLAGKILLQVESVGEAWYVLPDSQLRVYLGRPAQAFAVMRDYGLGIKSSDLELFLKDSFPQKLSGRILLAVEKNGEAYYINPDDLKAHYLGRPADAFKVMRDLGLGISNEDLIYIPSRDSFSPGEIVDRENAQKEADISLEEEKKIEAEKGEKKEAFEDDDNLPSVANIVIKEDTKLIPYQTDLITFISQAKDIYELVKYVNSHFNLKADNDILVARNYESVYQERSATRADLASLFNFALRAKGYQSGVLRFDDNLVVVFRDDGLPKYLAFSDSGVLVFQHGWSFKQIVTNEQKRLNIVAKKYAFFEGNVSDYRQVLAPYKWINL